MSHRGSRSETAEEAGTDVGAGLTVVRRDRRPPTGPFPVVAAAIATGALAIGTISVALAAGKGLDLTDEGLSLINASFPEEYLTSTVQAQLVWGPVFDLAGSVSNFRLVKLVLMVAGAAAVGLASLGLLPLRSRAARLAFVSAVTAGGLAPWIWLPQSPGYNELSTLAMLALVALTLLLLQPREDERLGGEVRTRLDPARPAAVGALAAWGVALWVLALAKWPAALLFGLVSTVLLVDFRRAPWRQLAGAGMMVAGAVAAALFTHAFLAPLDEVLSGLRTGTSNVSESHSLTFLLDRYWDDLSSIPRRLLIGRWWAVAAAIVLGWLLGRPSTRAAGRAGVAAAAMAFAAASMLTGAAAGGPPNIWSASRLLPELLVLLLITMGTAAAMDRTLTAGSTPNMVRGAALLWVAPCILAFGTANVLWWNAVLLAACWIAAMALTTSLVLGDDPMVTPALTATGAVLVAFGAVTGTWLDPYRQVPLSQVDTEIEAGPAAGLMVDADTATMLDDFASVAPRGGGPLSAIVLWKRPGLVFAAGAVQPVYGWIPRDNPELAAVAVEEACSRSEPILIAFEDDELPEGVTAVLSSAPCADRSFEDAEPIRLPDDEELNVLVAAGDDPTG